MLVAYCENICVACGRNNKLLQHKQYDKNIFLYNKNPIRFRSAFDTVELSLRPIQFQDSEALNLSYLVYHNSSILCCYTINFI